MALFCNYDDQPEMMYRLGCSQLSRYFPTISFFEICQHCVQFLCRSKSMFPCHCILVSAIS